MLFANCLTTDSLHNSEKIFLFLMIMYTYLQSQSLGNEMGSNAK